MKYYFTFHTLILFFASLVLFSCKQDYARDIRLENEIIESFIWEYFTQYNDTVYDENGKIIRIEHPNPTDFVFVIESLPNANWYAASCASTSSNITKRMKRDYINRNEEILKFDSIKNFPKKIVYINNETLRSNVDREANFIGLGYIPIIHVSRPGISKDRKEAFVYFENTKLGLWSGVGYCVVMEYVNGKWIIQEKNLDVIIN